MLICRFAFGAGACGGLASLRYCGCSAGDIGRICQYPDYPVDWASGWSASGSGRVRSLERSRVPGGRYDRTSHVPSLNFLAGYPGRPSVCVRPTVRGFGLDSFWMPILPPEPKARVWS
ncbi:unnamed protein product [Prunus armeniaca]